MRHATILVALLIRWLSLAIALGSAAALLGCDFGIDLSGPGPDRSVPEVHGRHISSAHRSTPITWSPSGEEVTFISGDLRMAYAYHPQSGAMRQLYASNTLRDRIRDAQLSADGVDWFTISRYVGDTVGPNVVRRHTSAGSTVLTDRGGAHSSNPPLMRWVLVAPSQPVVAFIVSPDSLFLLRRGGEPTLLGTACYGVVAFSPDESRVLCSVGSVPSSFRVFRMDGGAAESLDLPDEVAEEAQVIRWDAKGIQVLTRPPMSGSRTAGATCSMNRSAAPHARCRRLTSRSIPPERCRGRVTARRWRTGTLSAHKRQAYSAGAAKLKSSYTCSTSPPAPPRVSPCIRLRACGIIGWPSRQPVQWSGTSSTMDSIYSR